MTLSVYADWQTAGSIPRLSPPKIRIEAHTAPHFYPWNRTVLTINILEALTFYNMKRLCKRDVVSQSACESDWRHFHARTSTRSLQKTRPHESTANSCLLIFSSRKSYHLNLPRTILITFSKVKLTRDHMDQAQMLLPPYQASAPCFTVFEGKMMTSTPKRASRPVTWPAIIIVQSVWSGCPLNIPCAFCFFFLKERVWISLLRQHAVPRGTNTASLAWQSTSTCP